jgi:4-nitrophenyl phosphatase
VIAQEAGLRIWERTDPEPPRVIVIMDQDGWEIIPECDRIVSMAYQCQKNGVPLELLLPNPDIIYPDKKGTFGLTSGAIALMIEGALKVLLGENAPSFQGLGKPHSPLFDKAKSLYPNKTMVMIGDQKNTDIEGALRAGLKAALVLTGVSSGEDPGGAHFILQDLRMS